MSLHKIGKGQQSTVSGEISRCWNSFFACCYKLLASDLKETLSFMDIFYGLDIGS